MTKLYKPLSETSSRNRPCLRCFHCRTQTFRSLKKLESFCAKKELKYRIPWRRRIIKDGEVQIYWCTKFHGGPRIYRECDPPFIANCIFFNGGDIDGTA